MTSPSRPDLLVLSSSADGHHPEYLRWILEGARCHGVERIAVGGPERLLSHAGVRLQLDGVRGFPLPETDAAREATSYGKRERLMQAAVQRAVETLRPRAVLLTTFDAAQIGLATGLRFRFPVSLSGILMRPPLRAPTSTARGRLRTALKRTLLRTAMRNPHVNAVFTLDPDAVAPLERMRVPAIYLPDPVDPPTPGIDSDAVRARFGIPPDHQIAVLFGSLEHRKGFVELLRALTLLPPDRAARLTTLIVGTAYEGTRAALVAAVAEARAAGAAVAFEEAFLPDDELASIVDAAAVILAPYRGHVGSSGVLLRAAAAGVPVLGPSTGQMGREIQRHQLGVPVDTSDVGEIARGLVDALDGVGFDARSAAAYAAAHSPERFADALFSPPSPLAPPA